MAGDEDAEREDARPEDAFALVGNRIRAEIIRVLGEHHGDGDSYTLPFSELRARVEPDVDSSKFNYHLQKLVGRYVERVEDGYRMRARGISLYRTIVAGTFTGGPDEVRVDAEFDCHFCGAGVEAVYEDGTVTVVCPDCEHVYSYQLVPPSALADEADLLARIDQYGRHDTLAFSRGVCPNCVGGLDTSIIPASEEPFHSGERLDVFVVQACEHCGAHQYMSLGVVLLRDPGLVSFCWERGLDVTTTPVWELDFANTDDHVEVRSRDPWELALTVELDGDALELVVDGDLNVLERTVSSARGLS